MSTKRAHRWCWHRWPRNWSDGTATFKSLVFRTEREGAVQYRRCKKCGLLKIREVVAN